MYAYEALIFDKNCHALAAAARALGATLRKLPEHAIAIEVRGESVSFPVPSDDRDWLMTTPEEAFYAAMLDAEAVGAVPSGEEKPLPDVPLGGRISALTDLLGGKAAFAQVLRAGGVIDEAERFRR